VKTLQDGKKVTVEIDCNPISSEKDDYEGEDDEGRNEEDEEDDGMEEGYRCLISVEDSGKTMQIGAFVTDQLRIQRVTLFPANKAPTADSIFSGLEETSVYGGPVFDELDDTLQNAFYDWLGNMGVDDDLAARVSDYASSKEQHEYVGWLKGVHGFVAKK
jgi:complement component 1 Q subcomponent-binding protein, mitochondrial